MMDRSVLSANLRRIRSARGKTQVQLAAAAGLSRVGYRNIEAGEVAPRLETVVQIARALGVGVEELLAPAQTLQHIRFRAKKKLSTRENIIADVTRQVAAYDELERMLDEPSVFRFANAAREIKGKKGRERAIAAAAAARTAAGIRDDELIRDVCGCLEHNGVKVLTPTVASEEFFGLSIAQGGGGPAVVVNTWERISVERWIFTAAHELGHLLLHAEAFDVERTDEELSEESEADLFAGRFLMPDSVFKRELQGTAGLGLRDRVLKLKRIFRVSYKTVLFRIAEDLPAAQRPRLWMRFQVEQKQRVGKGLGRADEPNPLSKRDFFGSPAVKSAEEPDRLLASDFREERLARLVRKALEAGLIDAARAADVLRLTMDEMQSRIESWK